MLIPRSAHALPVWPHRLDIVSDSLANWHDVRTWPFIPLPAIATDPNGGTTVGFLPVWLFTDQHQQIQQIFAPDLTHNTTLGLGGTLRFFSYPSQDTEWYVLAGGAVEEQYDIDLRYATGLSRQDWWSFEGRLRFERDPTERFFGLGNSSDEQDETNYALEQVSAEARFGLNLSPTLQIALEVSPRSIRIRRGAFTSLPFTGSQFPRIEGLGNNHELLTRLILSYDTRDSIKIPSRGSLLNVFGGLADRRLLSSVSYSLFGLEARHYQPLGSRFTLAGYVAARYMPVDRQVPFWALSRLGGDRSVVGQRYPLRGFGTARFVDRHLFVASLELRSRVFGLDIFRTQARLELAPFVDIGRVFSQLDANPFSNLHPVAGIGFRGIAEPFVVGYVDIGYGSEGVAVFTGIDYPF